MRNKPFLPFLLLFFSSLWLNAQNASTIQWQKTLGGGGVDQAKAIRSCSDGGFIVTGYTTSAGGDVGNFWGGYDVWVVKLDASGIIQWEKAYGGSSHDWSASVEQMPDGGFVVAGYTMSNNGDVTGNNGDFDYWIIKIDASGNLLWQKTFGGLGIEHARSVQPCFDGGFIVTGSAWSINGDVTGNQGSDDYWLVRLDDTGNLLWQKTLGGPGNDLSYFVKQTNDGGFIVAGSTNSTGGDVAGNHGDYDMWILKLDGSGNIVWQKALGGTAEEQAYGIIQSLDGGYVAVGFTASSDGDVSNFHGAHDYWVVKLDSIGGIEWQKALGGTGVDDAYSVAQTPDGGYIVAGFSNSVDGNVTSNSLGGYDYWVVKMNGAGEVEWNKKYGGSGVDQAYSIDCAADGGYALAGYSTSLDGDVTGVRPYGDYWIVKLSAPASINDLHNSPALSVYPNPSSDVVTVEYAGTIERIAVYDALGRWVKNEYSTSFSVDHLTAGVYNLQINTVNASQMVRFVKK